MKKPLRGILTSENAFMLYMSTPGSLTGYTFMLRGMSLEVLVAGRGREGWEKIHSRVRTLRVLSSLTR